MPLQLSENIDKGICLSHRHLITAKMVPFHAVFKLYSRGVQSLACGLHMAWPSPSCGCSLPHTIMAVALAHQEAQLSPRHAPTAQQQPNTGVWLALCGLKPGQEEGTVQH